MTSLYKRKTGGGMIDEFGAIISLKRLWCDAKLCMSISNEVNNIVLYIRFMA